MRWGLAAWCLAGAALIGLKAHLDMLGRGFGNVAVSTSAAIYHVPHSVVLATDDFKADLAKLAGCWDARLDSLLPRSWVQSWCDSGQVLELSVHAQLLGAEAAEVLREKPLRGVFRGRYAPTEEQAKQALDAWFARGEWVGRQIVTVPGSAFVRLQSSQTPWVVLLTREPQPHDSEALSQVYAGRCYRPDQFTDIGMTCEIAQHLDRHAAFEYTLDQDGAPSLNIIHAAVRRTFGAWRVR